MKVAQSFLRQWSRRSFQRFPAGVVGRPFYLSSAAVESLPKDANLMALSVAGTRRAFSSESQSVLLDILAKEEQEEHHLGNTELPAELADLKATIEQDWRVVENGATTSLYKKVHSHKVHLSFHCQDTVEEMISEYGETEVVDDDEEVSAPVRFTITVSKAGKSLVFSGFSEYGQIKIEGVSTTAVSPETIHENQGTLAKTEYQGPDFLELAEELQEQLHVYLDEECGVNADVAAFIAMYSDYREEMCYVNWLKETQAIVS
jgi:complement component 1 Q subcomponent-binding protein